MDLDGEDTAVRGDVQCLSFVKITKGGLVKKVVREVYLRDDVPCGIKTCILCNERSGNSGLPHFGVCGRHCPECFLNRTID